jgi:hypothetical protein
LKTDGTSGRRIHGWLKPPSNPPENLPFSPQILRRGEDESITVIQTRVLNRFQGVARHRGESARADFEQKINYEQRTGVIFPCKLLPPLFSVVENGVFPRWRHQGILYTRLSLLHSILLVTQ